jgi:hypothetical protein
MSIFLKTIERSNNIDTESDQNFSRITKKELMDSVKKLKNGKR